MLPALIPLILGQVAQRAAPKVIDAIVDSLVKSPNVPVTQDNAQATREALEPVVRQAANKGGGAIVWGAFGSILGGLSTLAYAIGAGEANPEVYITALVGLSGGCITLVGRWRAVR